MKQKRLRRHLRIDYVDAVLDNILLLALAAMALVAYIIGVSR